jgi:hypothetical protein
MNVCDDETKTDHVKKNFFRQVVVAEDWYN